PRLGLRGLSSAASLKQLTDRPRPAALERLRGLSSAASLKPRWPVPQTAPKVRLRGLSSAASLKLFKSFLLLFLLFWTPGTQLRALIEARSSGCGGLAGSGLRGLSSAASLKRLLGLDLRRGERDSADSAPRPH